MPFGSYNSRSVSFNQVKPDQGLKSCTLTPLGRGPQQWVELLSRLLRPHARVQEEPHVQGRTSAAVPIRFDHCQNLVKSYHVPTKDFAHVGMVEFPKGGANKTHRPWGVLPAPASNHPPQLKRALVLSNPEPLPVATSVNHYAKAQLWKERITKYINHK